MSACRYIKTVCIFSSNLPPEPQMSASFVIALPVGAVTRTQEVSPYILYTMENKYNVQYLMIDICLRGTSPYLENYKKCAI